MPELAPWTTTPAAPKPLGGDAYWFKGKDEARLRAGLFTPPGSPRGTVVLSSGHTEPIEKYFEVINDLMAKGFVVLVNEWRGQGLSHRNLPDRLKSHALSAQTYVDDYHAMLGSFETQLPKPWIAVGHSMGGCLTLLSLAKGEASRFVGSVLCAPMLGINLPPFADLILKFNLLIGRREQYAIPPVGDPYKASFEANILTHDRARFDVYRGQIDANHDLVIAAPTWGWMDFALSATRYLGLPENLAGVTCPVVIVSAGNDKLVTSGAQLAAAKNLPDGRLIKVEGAEHEILMETNDKRDQFWAAFDGLTNRLAPRPA
jgi:lysophospholipase